MSIGPQHPGSGHFRLLITLDGDIITDVVPDPGYVHRGAEKMAEYRNYIQNIPHLERPVIIDSIGITLPYCMAAEELLGLTPPPRAQYLRTIAAELNRIISHLYWLGIYGPFLGHTTMFMWPIGDRELFIDLAQMITGARVTFAYPVPGGVRCDMPEAFKERAFSVCDHYEKRLLEYEKIFFRNPLVIRRTEGVGILKREDAISLGVTGPNLRASGVRSDVRKDEPYCAYGDLDFEIPSYSDGDCQARAQVRLDELRQSLKIIRQCVKQIPAGPVKALPRGALRARPGDVFARSEAARGTMAYWIVSDGGATPYRLKLSVPSFRCLSVMTHLLVGARLADMPPIYWGLDYWPVEADK